MMNANNNYLETKKIKDLKKSYFYEIYNAKRIQTIYGPSTLLYLYDNESNKRFTVFLPKRYNDRIHDGSSDGPEFPYSIGALTNFKIKFVLKIRNSSEQYDVEFRRFKSVCIECKKIKQLDQFYLSPIECNSCYVPKEKTEVLDD